MRRLVLIAAAALSSMLLLPVIALAAPPTVNSFIVKSGNTATFDRTVPVQIDVTGDVRMRFSTDDGGTWSEWGDSADTTDVVLPDLDGTYTVTGEFESDTLETVQASDSIVLDRIAPDAFLHVSSVPNLAGWYKKAPIFWFTNSEPPAVFYWWNDPAAWVGFYPGSTTESPTVPGGVNTLSYYARDWAGNDGPTLNETFKVDETSPTATLSGYAGGWVNTTQTITLQGDDGVDPAASGLLAVDPIRWNLDGTAASGASGAQLGVENEGDHVLEYWSLDVAGNESQHHTQHVLIDETSPTVSASPSVEGWQSNDVTLTFSGADSLSTVNSGIDGYFSSVGGEAAVPGAQRTLSQEGVYQVEFWSRDNAGNRSLPSAQTVKIDKTKPVTTSNAVASYDRSAAIVLNASDGTPGQVSGIAKTEWQLDGGAWQSTPLPPVTELGTHTLYFRSTDNAGNEENAKSATFRVWSGAALILTPSVAAPKYNGEGLLDVRLLDSTGSVMASQTVVFSRWDGTKWLEFPVTTDASGYVHLRSQYLTTARTYVIRFDRTDKYESAATVTYTFLPKVKLTRSTSWKTISRNKAYYAKGYIEPKHGATNPNKVKVYVLKRGADKKYRLYKTFKASYSAVSGSTTKSRYSAKVVIKSKGTYKLVAYHAADSANAETYGSTDYFTVK